MGSNSLKHIKGFKPKHIKHLLKKIKETSNQDLENFQKIAHDSDEDNTHFPASYAASRVRLGNGVEATAFVSPKSAELACSCNIL